MDAQEARVRDLAIFLQLANSAKADSANLANLLEGELKTELEVEPESGDRLEDASSYLPPTKSPKSALAKLTLTDIDRIVEMAWEDRTTFDTIYDQFGISEAEVIKIMRKSMKRSSFLMWRERVQGRKTKHAKTSEAQRFCCDRQSKPKERRKSR